MPFPPLPVLDSSPKLVFFKLLRPLLWHPVILSTSPISYKKLFQGFVSLCNIKEHLRETYPCVLRMERECLPSNHRPQDKLMGSRHSQMVLVDLCLAIGSECF